MLDGDAEDSRDLGRALKREARPPGLDPADARLVQAKKFGQLTLGQPRPFTGAGDSASVCH